MQGVWNVIVAASMLASYAYAQTSTSGIIAPVATKIEARAITTGTSALPSQTSLSPCGIISSSVSAYLVADPEATSGPLLSASLALNCLESVPLDIDRSLAFIDYVSPFLQFQSTQAYLKNLPYGWTLDGVDIFGGLSQIAQNLLAGAYTNQWAFEKDLYTLVNILPRDFHLNLPLPLIYVFTFTTQISLVSVSLDGVSLPQLYSAAELERYVESHSNSTMTPSPIVSIDGEPAADYVLGIGLQSQQYQDPDAIYNTAFYSIPLAQQINGDAFYTNGHVFGFSRDNTTYVFANGTTLSQSNLATLRVPFDGVDSGAALFSKFEIPVTSTASASSPESATSTSTISTTTSVLGYPTPVVLHRDGYTGGYFLNNSSVAVLAINAFANPAETDDANAIQQSVIKQFLAACKAAGKTQLIVDLQGNGGGHIENGYDTFKQLFPMIEPFGATRFRSTPLVEYFSEYASQSGVYNYTFFSQYQVQAVVDENLQDFPNYKDFIGPEEIYGDNFTALMRYNLSDPTIQLPFVISGYYNNTNIAPQPFPAENIVLLYDGTCGSTCAIFSEFMKSQAGVRSIAVGGRPQMGPMQGVAGSKGAQVYTYDNIFQTIVGIDEIYAEENRILPPYDGPAEYNISLDDPPLGGSLGVNGRFNLRNNYHSTAPDELPLQFIYEATNCRLFYQPVDIISIVPLWERVVNVAWGDGKCVSGSSVNDDDTMPSGAYDTVPFGPDAISNLSLNSSLPGFVPNPGVCDEESHGIGSIIISMIS